MLPKTFLDTMKHSMQAQQAEFLQQGKPVFSGPAALEHFAGWWKDREKPGHIVLLCDTNTASFCLPRLMKALPADVRISEIVIPQGEKSKSIATCQQVWEQLTRLGIGRKDVLISLGGGVVTDLGGFAASTYLRGISFVHVPTTLMAMADAALGGKNGIDFGGAKNRVGLFAFAECTVCDPVFLETLPAQEWRSGSAEVFKHALIADADLWKILEEQGCTASSLPDLLHRIQRVKIDVVHRDPYERGVRKILNFGHSIGHALESESLEKDRVPFTHGEAIGRGMMIETEIGLRLAKMSAEESAMVCRVLEQHFGKADLRHYSAEALMKWIRLDKKNDGARVRMSLLTGIGRCDWDVEVKEQLILEVLMDFGAAA
ncbi:MAG: 3-dehydroquinate synthase [Bacteroidia bacterium]|nr:3-dehydroquinate synthase [Bacteroidia bacterium]